MQRDPNIQAPERQLLLKKVSLLSVVIQAACKTGVALGGGGLICYSAELSTLRVKPHLRKISSLSELEDKL